jgi:hypothetical protein
MPKAFRKGRTSGVRRVNLKRRSTKRPGKVFAKKVKEVLEATSEHKYIDTNLGANAITGATTVLLVLASPAQGIAQGQRIGERIKIRSLCNRFTLDSSTDAYNKWRITFVQWRGSDVAPPLAADIYQNSGDVMTSPWNRANLLDNEFKVLYDKVFVTSQTAGNSGAIVRQVNFYGKRLYHKDFEYDGATTIADWKIYVLVTGDSIAAPNPTFTLYNRMSYTDV